MKDDAKGLFGILFDLSFSQFLTTKILKILYVIFMVIAGIAVIGLIAASFAQGAAQGILVLLLSPIIWLLYVIFARIWIETIIVLFRIADNTRDTARNTGGSSTATAASAPPPTSGPSPSI